MLRSSFQVGIIVALASGPLLQATQDSEVLLVSGSLSLAFDSDTFSEDEDCAVHLLQRSTQRRALALPSRDAKAYDATQESKPLEKTLAGKHAGSATRSDAKPGGNSIAGPSVKGISRSYGHRTSQNTSLHILDNEIQKAAASLDVAKATFGNLVNLSASTKTWSTRALKADVDEREAQKKLRELNAAILRDSDLTKQQQASTANSTARAAAVVRSTSDAENAAREALILAKKVTHIEEAYQEDMEVVKQDQKKQHEAAGRIAHSLQDTLLSSATGIKAAAAEINAASQTVQQDSKPGAHLNAKPDQRTDTKPGEVAVTAAARSSTTSGQAEQVRLDAKPGSAAVSHLLSTTEATHFKPRAIINSIAQKGPVQGKSTTRPKVTYSLAAVGLASVLSLLLAIVCWPMLTMASE
eukprot:TRINITY_DN97222_c0_g1_i1.p1 TRINITY_DN97222_c0_g1~~TRINITY_DN97222_c0_g1_i1.p1  ORF type:complete len:412 (+),score=90.18 TRINITY_DN97222_c0_g1_i1:114-1349(+)